MVQSVKQRQDKFKVGQLELGRLPRLKWCTPTEHDQCDAFLRKLRGEIESLDWYECETSGHLRAIGNQGEYWIDDSTAWKYLDFVTADAAGPSIKKIGGNFDSLDEAKAFAEAHDTKL